MDTTAIKIEPGTSAEDSVAVTFTEIDIEFPRIKNEYSESISQKNSDERSSSESGNHRNFKSEFIGFTGNLNPDRITNKAREISFTEIELEIPNIKMEHFEPSDRIHQSPGSFNVGTVSFKLEPGPREVDGGGMPDMKVDIELPDIEKECLKRFQRFAQTTDSLMDLTYTGKKPFSCCDCKYSCSRKCDLVRHLRTHSGEKPFSCPDCNYSCSESGNLRKHMLTHSGAKPFSCSDCSYSCFQRSHLMTHIMTHSREKPFLCLNCSYSCSNQSNLKRHMRTHSREKPFSCYCSYSCSDKGSLKTHMLTHSGEKPFLCSDCNYACSRKSSLKRHKLTHNGEKP